MRPVVIVQHEPDVPPGLIAEVLEADGIEHVVLEAWTDVEWPAVDDVSAVIVLGGVMNVDEIDDYPFLARSRSLMADAMRADVPTLGVCLGSQMMARVMGAEVFRSNPRNAFFGRVELTPAGMDDPVLETFDGVPVLQFHEDTFKVPDGGVPLASSVTSGLAQAFRVGARAYAIQFHFEVDLDIVRGWCDAIGDDAMAAEWGAPTEDLMADADRFMAAQRQAGVSLVRRFLELVSR